MITDSSYSVYLRRRRAATLAAFHSKKALPLDESTYLVQKTGCCDSTPIFIPPVFSITCSDTTGTNTLPTVPTTAFTLTPTSVGVGVAFVQYVDSSSAVLDSIVIATTGPVLLQAPPAGTAIVQYTFRCTPAVINIACGSSNFTESWQPLQFHNTGPVSLYIAFVPDVSGQWIDPSGFSTTVVGITSYSVNCSQTVYRLDISSAQTVVEGTTISIYNAYDKAAAIQFYDAEGGLVIVDQYNNTVFPIETAGSTGYTVVPAGAVRFTATPAVLYDISSCDQWAAFYPITPDFPLLFIGTGISNNITVRFRNNLGGFVDDVVPNPFVYGSAKLYLAPPVGATQLETYCI